MFNDMNSDKLPILTALIKNTSFSTGACNPFLVRCVNNNSGKKEDYVLKLISSSGISKQAYIRELLGLIIAKQIGLNVVEPAIINVTLPFVQSINKSDQEVFSNSLGYNFGTKYMEGVNILSRDQKILGTILAEQASKILLFDIFINNVDRTKIKPNMFSDGKNIYLFDHEKAFSFTLMFSKPDEPWKIQIFDLEHWISKHYFYNTFKGTIINIDDFIDSIKLIDESFWQKAENLIPSEWFDSKHFNDIKDYLSKIVINCDIFKSELERILK